MNRKSRSPLGIYTIIIAALFMAGFLLLVFFGAGSYRNTVQSQTDNMEIRTLSSYFWTVFKANDQRDAVEISESSYGTMLSIYDRENSAVIRIYPYEGGLMEEYSDPDLEPVPEDSELIGKTSVFEAEFLEDDVLKIKTDEGTVLVTLRSGGGK